MIDVEVPAPLIWLLRWTLFLGPLAAVMFLGWRLRSQHRKLVGCLFAFLYGVGTIFATHQMAIQIGWWTYGGDTSMLSGMPVDIWLGGSILFGPVLYMAFPRTGPIFLVLPIIIGLHGTIFSSLAPLVIAGPDWFLGVLLVFLTAHIPAIYLARWTSEDRLLPVRAAFLALGFGFLAFMVLPSVIMHAMGGAWNLAEIPLWRILTGLPALGLCFIIGLSAVQMFVVHGEGTPVPLDCTKRLVRTGIYAYVSNPMQLCSAMGWVIIGFIIGNIWVSSAAIMAWVFVLGMVRWHHRHDLLVRFPDGWPEYRINVPEWLPRWMPWVPEPATLSYEETDAAHRKIVSFLQNKGPIGLKFHKSANSTLTYQEPNEIQKFNNVSAFAKTLNHLNFFWCLIGAGILIVALPYEYLRGSCSKSKGTSNASTAS